MAPYKFSHLCSVVCLFLVPALEIGFVLKRDWVDRQTVVKGIVSDEAFFMAFKDFGIPINHVAQMIFLSFLMVLLSLDLYITLIL